MEKIGWIFILSSTKDIEAAVSDEGEIILSIEGDTRPTIIHEGRYEGRDDIYFC